MENSKNLSKGRALLVAAVLITAAIVATGVGLGLGIRKNCDCPEEVKVVQSTTTETQLPLEVPPSASKEGHYRFASVAADAGPCSEIGTRIMATSGGSAVDSAVATILCVGVLNGHSCGIGGGHFATYYNRSTGESYAIIAREMAPSGASEDMFLQPNASSQEGGLAIGIPGEIRGLHKLWSLGGKLQWKELFEPTIRLCRDGYKVTRSMAEAIASRTADLWDRRPALKTLLTNPQTGTFFKEGEIMRRPKLADTLEIIANEGPDAFYNGSLSKNISLDIKDAGGIITEDDLANYTAAEKAPLILNLTDGFRVYSPPPPSSGAVYEFILNTLQGYNFTSDSVSSVDRAILTWHRITEGFKHAYSLRSQLGDADVGTQAFKDHIAELVQNMTNPSYGEAKRQKIDDSRTFGLDYYEPAFEIETDHGTAHLSVVGPNGDAVSMTSTINLYFGSKIVGSRTGIIFNDEMDDFSTPNTTNFFGVPASPANFIRPWKRPLSSMCPSIIVDKGGEVSLVVGASGGTKITTSTALVTMESLWFKMGIKEAIDYPRIHHQLLPPEIQAQKGFPQVLIDGLKSKGHNITLLNSAGSVVQGVLSLGKESVSANSDYRKGGYPDGY